MDNYQIRTPAAAGRFYSAQKSALRKEIESFIDIRVKKRDVIACILPHAGYIYSGKVAGETISGINVKDKIILIGPNHTGYGPEFSIMSQGSWQTPLGEIKIDAKLSKELLNHSQFLKKDTSAHLYEHSLEVELPFLQYFKTDFEIVPIVIFPGNLKTLKEFGGQIASVIKKSGREKSTLLIASSDMTHYEPQVQAKKKDREAIEAIIELNEDKFIEKVEKLNISICGYAPIAIALSAAKKLGAKQAELIKYQTSAEINGDINNVVGYAGIIIY